MKFPPLFVCAAVSFGIWSGCRLPQDALYFSWCHNREKDSNVKQEVTSWMAIYNLAEAFLRGEELGIKCVRELLKTEEFVTSLSSGKILQIDNFCKLSQDNVEQRKASMDRFFREKLREKDYRENPVIMFRRDSADVKLVEIMPNGICHEYSSAEAFLNYTIFILEIYDPYASCLQATGSTMQFPSE